MAGGAVKFNKMLNNSYDFELWITQESQDITGNRSYVKWELRLVKRGTLTVYSTIQNPWTAVVDGQRWSGTTTYNFNNYIGAQLGWRRGITSSSSTP